jgi:predicted ATPase
MHSGVTASRLNQLQMVVKQAAARPTQGPPQAALCDQFAQVMLALAQRHPLVLIVDDLQWIDPGSVALLFHLGRRLAGSNILLLGAYRPEEVLVRAVTEPHPLLGVAQELQMACGDIEIDLMRCEGATFIAELLDSEPNAFGDEFRARLNQRTSGNPLFTIELLRGMQLRGEIRRDGAGRWEEAGPLNWETLPARVEAGIARRLAYLSPECRELLAIASVEGEQFTAEVAGAVLQRDPQQVTGPLSGEAGRQHQLVIPHSLVPADGQQLALYRFRHALFQTYLYTHLDLVEQADLHGRVGENLERLYQPSVEKFPEIAHALARHFAAAGATGKAVQYYAAAGKNALRLSAAHEAVAHLNNALQLLQTLPPSPWRNGQELDLLLSLAPAMTATRGWAPPEMAAAYQRAEELLEQIDDNAQLIPALFLLAVFRSGRSEHEASITLGDRAVRLARQSGDPLLISLANLHSNAFYQGNFREGRARLQVASATPDLTHQSLLAKQFGLAPAVLGLAYLAECSWILGFPEESESAGRAARELAAQLQHPMTTCYVLGRACWLAGLQRDRGAMATLAAALLPVAQQYRLHNFTLAAGFHQRWALVQGGLGSVETLGEMQQAIEGYRATGTLLNLTAFLALFAQACAVAGQVERGLAAVGESLALGRPTGERWYEAEALRIKGELLLQQAGAPVAEARACFEEARETAAAQGAAALELRATLGLCRHWPELPGNLNHLRHLVSVLSEQSGGHETPYLLEAQTLLAQAPAS